MSFSLANLLREHVQNRPESVAFQDGEKRLTFAELGVRSSRVGHALSDAGVQPGDRVAVLMKNALEYFEVAFGCNKIGATVVALNWRLALPEIAEILDDATPVVVVVDEEHRGMLPDASEGLQLIQTGAAYEQWLADAAEDDPHGPDNPEAVALILYSSGTTGRPKGIMLTNHNLSFITNMAHELFRMSPDGVHLVVSPLFHIGGIGTGLTTTSLGGRTVLLRDTSPQAILGTIERERVTHAFFVPAVIQRLVELTEEKRPDLSSLQLIAYGAAPMTETLLLRSLEALGCGFVGCYGMTETAGTVVALPPEEHQAEGPQASRLRSVGRQLSWAEVRVTDLETEHEAAPGQIGEIWVRSEANMLGYFNQPEATEQTLVDGGWLRTGDGAYRDEEGYFFLADRIKDMIISGGENVYPAEVENVLAAHPAVSEVAVIGVPSEKWGETVKAVVVLRPGGELTGEELVDFARERLARYKCPTSVEFVPDLPRGATGKVLKVDLRRTYAGL